MQELLSLNEEINKYSKDRNRVWLDDEKEIDEKLLDKILSEINSEITKKGIKDTSLIPFLSFHWFLH